MALNHKSTYDLAIVGSGSAAFSTAIHAKGLGASVVLIEQGIIGGTCVNVGCVPSKALLAAAEARHIALTQMFPGINTNVGPVDMKALLAGKRDMVTGLRKEKYEDLAKVYGFEITYGVASFAPNGSLSVKRHEENEDMEIQASHYVIATGASPFIPPIPGLGSVNFLTSTTAMEVEELPRHIIVIGANAVGLEQAQLFSHLGARVTIVELQDRIAPFEEPEISETLRSVLVEEGVQVLTGSAVESVRQEGKDIKIDLKHLGENLHLEGDAILIATGRTPNTSNLGLKHMGVEVGPKGEVLVDDQLKTTNPKVFAAGDVTGAPQFVYVAGQHGTIVADNAISNAGRKVDYRTLPRVTFTTPQIASVGLTDQAAIEAGYSCDCRVLDLSYVPRALVNRNTKGLVKIVADGDTGRVLGVHMLADGAAESILAGVYALEANFTVEKLASVWAPYLTMSESIRLTAQSFNRNVSLLSCCAS
ncbi:mercuric reductase [Ferrithrix thermotolerans DSM 19514]|uniref:Mercuric reductase n=1 Tax=Ferrithrix thermotolerans DSM 19514 TaxID=1121881 RepID=A0A1M4XYW6_9ACTN|nr:mercuric reductase [Ferrithrix thermotolerans DSM 19514]